MKRVLIEAAVDSVTDAEVAFAHGADRVEICRDLPTNGLTPPKAWVAALAREHPGQVVAMVRQNPNSYEGTDDEAARIAETGAELMAVGACGLVFGFTRGDVIDASACRRVLQACTGGEAVFHRAFDALPDWMEALETVIDLGFARLLTSGGVSTRAPGAVDRLALLVEAARGRIEILPGGGVRADNARYILSRTGAGQMHASCRSAGARLDPRELAALRREVDLNGTEPDT